jgi:hypothetical protein
MPTDILFLYKYRYIRYFFLKKADDNKIVCTMQSNLPQSKNVDIREFRFVNYYRYHMYHWSRFNSNAHSLKQLDLIHVNLHFLFVASLKLSLVL